MRIKTLFLTFGLVISAAVCFILLQAQTPARILEFDEHVEIYRSGAEAWQLVKKGDLLHENDRLRTSGNSTVKLQLSKYVSMVLERNSQMKLKGSTFLSRPFTYKVHLFGGSLLVASSNIETFKSLGRIQTPNAVISGDNAIFRVSANLHSQTDSITVLQGKVKIVRQEGNGHELKYAEPLEKVEIRDKVMSIAQKISTQEWQDASPAYELSWMPTYFEFQQNLLAGKAGNLFRYVTEHGDFYTPKHGFFLRQFLKDGHETLLKLYYDVFPESAFAGLYLKIQGLDVKQYKTLQFQIKSDGPAPEILYLEFKAAGDVLQSFPIQKITEEWKQLEVPLRMSRIKNIDEIVIYLRHTMAAEHLRGNLVLKDFNLVSREGE